MKKLSKIWDFISKFLFGNQTGMFRYSILILLFASCTSGYTTKYKIITPKGSFYTNVIETKGDSIFFVESNKNSIRRVGAFKVNEVKIKE